MLKLLLLSCSLFITTSRVENQRLHELYKLPIYKLLSLEFRYFNRSWEMGLMIMESIIKSNPNNWKFLLMNDFCFWSMCIKHPSRTAYFLFYAFTEFWSYMYKVIIAAVTYDHKLGVLKKLTNLWSFNYREVWKESHWAKIKVLVGLYFFLEGLGENLFPCVFRGHPYSLVHIPINASSKPSTLSYGFLILPSL